ncbi:MAG: TetR/AcrR family transcriptional regulator [Actinomycetota bacterium]
MTETDETTPVDGRSARRQRNIEAALDAVFEMFQEEAMMPSMEKVAARSGLSLRSLYRYFADPAEMFEATIQRTLARAQATGTIDDPGHGSFDDRLAVFVTTRLELHEEFGAAQQAAMVNAFDLAPARDQVERNRIGLRTQFELQFEPELKTRTRAERERVVAATDVLTQIESIRYLRHHRGFTVAETRKVLTDGVRALLAAT